MMTLPKIEKPHPDELLYSWVCRTGQECGMNAADFEYFLRDGKGYKRYFKIDLGFDFVQFCQTAHLDADMLDIFITLSTFPFESIAMSDNRQRRYVNTVFAPEGPLNLRLLSIYEPVRLCPECMKEDMEQYGHIYLHRSHNLSGVCVCHKHGCRLLEYKGKPGLEYKYAQDDYKEMQLDVSMEDALCRAEYSNALLMSGMKSDARHVKAAIIDKIKDEEHTVNGAYEIFMNRIKEWEHAALFNGIDVGCRMKNTLQNANGMSMRDVVPFLMFLYPDINDLADACGIDEPIIQEYVCPDCGRAYCSSPTLQENGWGCPYCGAEEPVQERYKKLVAAVGDGQYIPLDPFQSMSTKIHLYHKKCGTEFAMEADSFLLRGARCDCEYRVAEEEAKAAVRALPGGFELKKFTNTVGEATVYHEECGHEFACRYVSFLHRPACHICGWTAMRTLEHFKYQVEELVGDEYTVVSDINSTGKDAKVSIRHNECGQVYEYAIKSFLSGQRCPYCWEKISFDYLKDMLEAYSGGRYVLQSHKDKSCTLLNTETGEKFNMQSPRILQEIRRPTPSTALPIEESKRKALPLSPWDQKYECLLRYKQEYGTAYVPVSTVYQGVLLGSWCFNQRQRHANGSLNYRKTKKLEAIGFPWALTKDTRWNETFSLLIEFQEKNGKNIPDNLEYKSIKLGNWCRDQRSMLKNGTLKQDMKEKLDSIGFLWDPQTRDQDDQRKEKS